MNDSKNKFNVGDLVFYEPLTMKKMSYHLTGQEHRLYIVSKITHLFPDLDGSALICYEIIDPENSQVINVSEEHIKKIE